jgi:tetratricopeptide (TPR) repeat protein
MAMLDPLSADARRLDGAKNSGNANMQIAAKNSFLVTDFPSSKSGIRCFSNCPKLYQQLAVSLIVKGANERASRDLGNKLVAIAEYAYPIQDNEALEEAALLMMALPLAGGYRIIGAYYLGLCAIRTLDFAEARRILSYVASCSIPTYRARALNSLGRVYLREGNVPLALESTLESTRIASSGGVLDTMPLMVAQLNLAIIDSVVGNHKRSLRDLEDLFPIVETMGLSYPQEYFSYFNSLALEMGEAGRFQEARNVIDRVLRSPIAHAYPDWFATRDEIIEKEGRAPGKFVAFGTTAFEPDNVLHLPAPTESVGSLPPASTGRGATILKFKKPKGWKGTSMAAPKESGEQGNPKGLNRKQKVIKIVDIVTRDLTEEQLQRILDSITKIASEK